jgi:hypothetical protein
VARRLSLGIQQQHQESSTSSWSLTALVVSSLSIHIQTDLHHFLTATLSDYKTDVVAVDNDDALGREEEEGGGGRARIMIKMEKRGIMARRADSCLPAKIVDWVVPGRSSYTVRLQVMHRFFSPPQSEQQ